MRQYPSGHYPNRVQATRAQRTDEAGMGQVEDARHVPVLYGIEANVVDVLFKVRFIANELIGQALANRYLQDLEAAGLGSGRHAFECTPSAGLIFAADAESAPFARPGSVVTFGSCRAKVAARRDGSVQLSPLARRVRVLSASPFLTVATESAAQTRSNFIASNVRGKG